MKKDTVNIEIGPSWTPLTTDETRLLAECAQGSCKFRCTATPPDPKEVYGHSLALKETSIIDSPSFARADPDTGTCIVVLTEATK